MSTTQQPEALRLAGEFKFCNEYDSIPSINDIAKAEAELRRLHTENTALQQGYAAARLEIESLRARSPIPPNSGEYPALPEPDTRWRAQFAGHGVSFHSEDQIIGFANERASAAVDADRAMRAAQPAGAQQPGAAYAALPSYEHQRAIMEAERNASLDEYSRIVLLTSTESRIYERAFTNGWNRRASHGQAPAQAAPAAVAGPSEFPHEQMDVMALARYKVMPSHESMLHRHAVVAGDGSQQLYIGREVECENMARKFAGAFLDGAFAFHSMLAAAPTTQPAPQQEALDAAFEAVRKNLCALQRYSFCLDDDGVVRRVQDRTGNWIEFDDAHKLFDPVAVDAARKKGANHD